MIEQQEMVNIEKRDLMEKVAALRSSGYRLVQICATTLADRYEMNYSFDRDLQFKNLRFTVTPGETVPSVSLIYGSAFLYENEIHDLFGIEIEHISIDYQGSFYKTRIPAPFALQPAPPPGGAAENGTQETAAAGSEPPTEDHDG
jgi:ech hydrogenase subunit D